MDEPVNGLDPFGIKEMRELFGGLEREENITILLSSHILSEIEKLLTVFGIPVNGSAAQELGQQEIKERYPKGKGIVKLLIVKASLQWQECPPQP